MAKLTERELLALIDAEEAQAVGYYGGEVSEQRRKALQYYHGQPFGNEVEGRSAYVSHDVAEAVETVMPALMRIFFAGDKVVKFEPQTPKDEEAAKQATDYINYIITKQNNGFLSGYQWFKDALLQKNGFLKVYWENYGEVKKESYENLAMDELVKMMTDNPELEVVEHSINEDGSYNIVLRDDQRSGKVCIDPVPPEEVLVGRGTPTDIRKARFVAHRQRKTVSEWKTMGYTVTPEEGDNEAEFDAERMERRAKDEDYNFGGNENKDPSSRLVWGLESYIRLDQDGDGIAELRKILKIGNKIHEDEEVDSIPFVSLTPYIMPHKFFGLSLADFVMDIMELKSTFIRQILDNMYNLNNGRYMVLEGMVNLQDALNSQPGGVVRVKTFDAMKRLDSPQLPNAAWQVLEWADMEKENRTGLSRLNPGPDENVLNKTATGANIRFQRVGERIELIARVFAETGFKDLCYAVLELVQKHQDKATMVKLRDQWVEMNPREWTDKFDMTVSVGLGTGTKEQILSSIGMLFQMQMNSVPLGIVTPTNIYNTLTKFSEASDLKGEDLYATHPSKIPPQPPQQNPEAMKAQADIQMAEKEFQRKAQDDERSAQLEVAKLQVKAQTEMALGQQEIAAKKEMKVWEIQANQKIKAAETSVDAMLEREKMASDERVNAMPDALAQLAEVAKQLAEARKPRKRVEKGTFNGKKYSREISEE
jgi:hypothetical protein